MENASSGMEFHRQLSGPLHPYIGSGEGCVACWGAETLAQVLLLDSSKSEGHGPTHRNFGYARVDSGHLGYSGHVKVCWRYVVAVSYVRYIAYLDIKTFWGSNVFLLER